MVKFMIDTLLSRGSAFDGGRNVKQGDVVVILSVVELL